MLLGAGLLVLLAYAGQTEKRYRCDGIIESESGTVKATVFLKLQLYERWMFWADTRGAAWSEIPNEQLEYYPRLSDAGDLIMTSRYDSKHVGGFSTLSHALQLGTPLGAFAGMCTPIRTDD